MIETLSTAATNTSGTNTCEAAESRWTFVYLLPVPLLSSLINVSVWLAATFYRKKLMRQSYVYSCVTSTLLSNTLFLCFHLWDEIEGFRLPGVVETMGGIPRPMSAKMGILWSLCTAAAVAMLFVVCGNLTVLIYVMLDSAYFRKSVRHRLHSSSSVNQKNTTASELQGKRRRAAFLVAFVWLLPLSLTVGAVFWWNCVGDCTCPPGSLGEICPHDAGCSRIWTPMTNSFIAVNVALWFIEILILFYVTISGIRKFQNYNFPSKRSTISTGGSPILHKSAADRSSVWLPSCSSAVTTVEDIGVKAVRVKSMEIEDDVFSANSRGVVPRRRLLINPRLRLVCYLTIVFVLCTVTIPIIFIVDLFADEYPVLDLRLSSMVLVQVYTLACPLLLVRHLTSLKMAVSRMLASVCRCLK